MNQAVPVNHASGPPRDKPPYMQNGVNNFIELSDSDSEGYEDAFHVPEVPAHSPHLDMQRHQLGGYLGANNQIFDLENNNLMYQPRLPQPAVAAVPENNAMARNLPPVKGEEGEMNWAQWMDEENDEGINRVLLEDYTLQAEYNRASHAFVDPSRLDQPFQPPEDNSHPPMMETKTECINTVIAVFPDICRDHLAGLYEHISSNSDQLISHILDNGTPYPKAKDVQKQLKRKRVLTEEEEAIQKYEAAGRVVGPSLFLERTLVRSMLSFEFPVVPLAFIDETLRSTGHRLFSAYRTLEEADRTFDANNPPYRRIKTPRKMPHEYRDGRIEASIQNNESPEKTDTLKELLVCRKIRKTAESRRLAEQQAILAEEENLKRAEAEGTMSECCCCYSDYPLNRMVHCNNEEVLHWFCRGCARQAAETEIGNSKYLLMCMSTDGCEAGFSLEQRNQFLDESTIVALERNEAEAVLRMAGIENLASCPFCPFAAEYPPVEINREFQCQAPDCEKVSCRLCKLESHIPMTCAENAKENGLSIRRQIEEAMSAAMIRTCNKCSTPFVKEEGCNKMTCTRNGCRNVQCYVCSKSCNYDHFNDVKRGGKEGNCPLFESVEERHNDEVKKAEKEALDRVRAEHPEYSEEDLRVKMSVNVTKDDERRRAADPVARNPYALYGPGAMGHEQDAWLRDNDLELARLHLGLGLGFRYALGDGDGDGGIARPGPVPFNGDGAGDGNGDRDGDAERERARNREGEGEAVRHHLEYWNGNGNGNENIALPNPIQFNADRVAAAIANRERLGNQNEERERNEREAVQQLFHHHQYLYRLQHPLGDGNGDANVVAVAERERERNGEREARGFAQRSFGRDLVQLGLGDGDGDEDGDEDGDFPDPVLLNAGGNEDAAALAAANVVADAERERERERGRNQGREREQYPFQYADGNGNAERNQDQGREQNPPRYTDADADAERERERERVRNQDREREQYPFQYADGNGNAERNQDQGREQNPPRYTDADAEREREREIVRNQDREREQYPFQYADGNGNAERNQDQGREQNPPRYTDADAERERERERETVRNQDREREQYPFQYADGNGNAERNQDQGREQNAQELIQRIHNRYLYRNGNVNAERNQDQEREQYPFQYADGNEQEINNYPNFLPFPIRRPEAQPQPRPQPRALMPEPPGLDVMGDREIRRTIRNLSPPRLARDHNKFMGNRENLGGNEGLWQRLERVAAQRDLRARDVLGMFNDDGGEDFEFYWNRNRNLDGDGDGDGDVRDEVGSLKRERGVIEGIPMPEEDVFSDGEGGEGEKEGRRK